MNRLYAVEIHAQNTFGERVVRQFNAVARTLAEACEKSILHYNNTRRDMECEATHEHVVRCDIVAQVDVL